MAHARIGFGMDVLRQTVLLQKRVLPVTASVWLAVVARQRARQNDQQPYSASALSLWIQFG